MNAQDLKNSIFQLAIQGKLVEQKEEEGTAKELLTQIEVEKGKLLKGKKVGKQKEFPNIDEIPFDIPENWEWVKLEQLANINGGYAFKSKDYVQKGVRVIRISDFNTEGFIDKAIVRHEYDESLTRYLIEKSDILLCMTGGTVGKSMFVEELNEPMMTNQRVATIKIHAGLTPEYINYVVLSPVIQSTIRNSKNSTNDNISMSTIKDFTIPLPPYEEQKRIVAKIEELMPYVERYGDAYEEVTELNRKFPEEMEKSILQYAIQGKLVEQNEEEGTADTLLKEIEIGKDNLIRDMKVRGQKVVQEIQDDEIPFDIPKTWRWVRLSQLGVIIGGGTPKTNVNEYWEKGIIPWITPADMKNVEGKYISSGSRYITQIGLDKSSAKLMPKGTIVYSSRAPIGYLAIADNIISTNQGFKSLVPAVEDIKKYFYYCLISRTNEIQSRASGTTFKEISGAEFAKTVVPLPPLEEQKRIVARIEELLEYTKNLVKED